MAELLDEYKDYISKSRISTLDYCPRKFYHSYVLGNKEDDTFSTVVGTRFHNFAETFFKHALSVKSSDWFKFIRPQFSPYEIEPLKWFINQEINRLNKVGEDKFLPYSTEEMYYDHDLKIRGVIDRTDIISPKMLSYMVKDVGFTLSNKTFDRIIDNIKNRKQLVIIEYKTGKTSIKSLYVQRSIKKELTFYKIILSKLPEFEDYDIPCGCLINPYTREITYLDFMRESSILKKIDLIKDLVSRGDINEFKPLCNEAKYMKCGYCKTVNEAGLYNVTEDEIKQELEGNIPDGWRTNLYI